MAAARLLDVSRLASRAGVVATGVDRVELAYLRHLSADRDVPVFGLCRTAFGFVLLDRAGLVALAAAFAAQDFPPADLLSRLNRRLTNAAQRGQSFVRRLAIARCRRRKLRRMLRLLPRSFVYVNVGHSNLTAAVCKAVKARRKSRIAILLHDTIPLDWPDMQRAGTSEEFAQKLAVAQRFADMVICTSHSCAADVTRHMKVGRTPPIVIAHLGVDPPAPAPEDIPIGVMPLRPYFMIIGTIEPRKNHAMLLDVWDHLGPGAPALLICGQRGWRNAEVFARLDAGVPQVTEVPGLSDGAIASLLLRSQGLLFPSFAEGYGLPPLEAAALGVPVVTSDLPACRELLGNWAVYAAPQDRYLWEKEIKRYAQASPSERSVTMVVPDWASHFRIVLSDPVLSGRA